MRTNDHPGIDTSPRVIPAWAFSLVFHVVVLTAIGWSAQRQSLGTNAEVDRPVGIAMVERLPDRDRYSPPAKLSQPAEAILPAEANQSASVSAGSLAPANVAPPIDLDGMLAEMTAGDIPSIAVGELEGAFGGGADSVGKGGGPNLDGKPTTAIVFGVSGSGSRFIYVFDRSDSMNGFGGRPLRAAKKELKRSLNTLGNDQQFQIIFYNDEARPFVPAGSPLRLLLGEESMLRRATSYVDAIKAFGGTEHYEALRMALQMGPDVVFFLTDARVPRLSAAQLANVKQLADRCGATIHAIEFGTESIASPDSFLRQLAADNHGEYRYLSIDELTEAGKASDTAAPDTQGDP